MHADGSVKIRLICGHPRLRWSRALHARPTFDILIHMLAYVFWHWKRVGVQVREYESRLRQFHEALTHSPPDGFTWSWSAALKTATWANDGNEAYEDWYLVTGSAALDPLNDAAITASRQIPHDDAAAVAAGGTAGLYRLRAGRAFRAPGVAHWFAKPKGWSYEKLLDELRPLMTGDVALWGRQMTLAPALEFCLHANETMNLPAGIDAQSIPLRSVFPEGA